ncbi:MAG: hypothetical protein M3Q52_11690, partial [Pseudomonadota bacterium]|nr:hypothetical protein [Pseudomonadota bacterium]
MLRDLSFRLADIGLGALQWARNLPRRLKRSVYFLLNDIRVARGTVITGGSTIGRRTRINAASHLDRCHIGSYCAIGGRLIVRGANHRTEFLNMQDYAQRRIILSRHKVAGIAQSRVGIGNAVWIGDSVTVLAGVEIGDGAVIGA